MCVPRHSVCEHFRRLERTRKVRGLLARRTAGKPGCLECNVRIWRAKGRMSFIDDWGGFSRECQGAGFRVAPICEDIRTCGSLSFSIWTQLWPAFRHQLVELAQLMLRVRVQSALASGSVRCFPPKRAALSGPKDVLCLVCAQSDLGTASIRLYISLTLRKYEDGDHIVGSQQKRRLHVCTP